MGPELNRRYLLLAFCTMCLIWYLSGRPGGALPLPGGWDKLAHAAGYALLGYCLARGLGGGSRSLLALLPAVGYGALDEFHQSFVPGREASGFDLFADAVGAAAGILLVLILKRERPPGHHLQEREDEGSWNDRSGLP